MNLIELNRSLVQLRLSGMAARWKHVCCRRSPKPWHPST